MQCKLTIPKTSLSDLNDTKESRQLTRAATHNTPKAISDPTSGSWYRMIKISIKIKIFPNALNRYKIILLKLTNSSLKFTILYYKYV